MFLRLCPIESSVFDNQVSAKKGTNIDTLLENIVLVAEVIFALTYVVFLCSFLLEGPLPKGGLQICKLKCIGKFTMVLLVQSHYS